MKTYDVVLTKSYIVRIKSNNEVEAKDFCELFTGDIQDISTDEHRKQFSFEIENIECMVNHSFDVEKVHEEKI